MIADLSGFGIRSLSPQRGPCIRGGYDNGLLAGLTAYWKMDEAAFAVRADSMPNGLNLADVNNNLLAQPGKINNEAVLSQTVNTNGLKSAINSLFNTGPGISVSFSCWIGSGAALINDRGIISFDDGVANQAYALYSASSNLSVHWAGFEAGTHTLKEISVVTFAAMGAGRHHFAFGWDAVNLVLWTQYDNGARTTLAMAGMNPVSGIPFQIGNWSGGAAPNQFSIDELAYYRRVLSVADVNTLYNGGAGKALSTF